MAKRATTKAKPSTDAAEKRDAENAVKDAGIEALARVKRLETMLHLRPKPGETF